MDDGRAERCAKMAAAGFEQVSSLNPGWDRLGVTFEAPEGHRIVIQNAAWANTTGAGGDA